MPKDPKKNVDRYKIRGGDLNEFEFHQNQAGFAATEIAPTNLIPGTPPEAKAVRAQGLAKKARSTKKTTKTVPAKAVGKKKESKSAISKKSSKRASKKTSKRASTKKAAKPVKGATAKKLAAKKAKKK